MRTPPLKKSLVQTLFGLVLFTQCPLPASAQKSLIISHYDNAVRLYDEGKYRESLQLLREALQICEKDHYKDPTVAWLRLQVGETLRALGQYKEAEDNFKTGLSFAEKLKANRGECEMRIFNDLALLYMDQGRYVEAESLWRRNQDLNANNAYAVNHLANLYFTWGKLKEAETETLRAVKLGSDPANRNTIAVPYGFYNLAQLAILKGKYKPAESAYNEALKSCKTQFGEKHSYYTSLLQAVAELHRKESRYAEAESELREVLKLRQDIFNSDHPLIADAMSALAATLADEGKYREAAELAEKAAKNQSTVFEDRDNLYIARADLCLGNIYRQQGRYKDASWFIEQGLRDTRHLLGSNHIEVAVGMRDLAKLRADQANYSEAESLMKDAWSIIDSQTGPDHPERAVTARDLGQIYIRENKFPEAEQQFKIALQSSEKTLGENHAVTADGSRELGNLYLKEKKYSEALPHLTKALAIDEKLHGANAPQVASDLSALASVYNVQGQSAQAVPLLKRASEIKMTLPGAQNLTKPSIDVPVAFSSADDRPIRDKWALSIGISSFKDRSINLRYAAKDATDFRNFLVSNEHFKSDHVKLLTDQTATRENIINVLGHNWLGSVTQPDDLVVIYISSHGSSALQETGGVNFLVAHDTDKTSLPATGIPMQWLTKIIKDQVHASRVLLILDVCHSGAAASGGKGISPISSINPKTISIGGGQMVLCSSMAEQVSWESKNYENSVFTRRLIEALQANKDKTTILQAYEQLKLLVEDEVLRDRSNLQTPVLWNKDWVGKDPVLAAETLNDVVKF